jgi:hypothetical protein
MAVPRKPKLLLQYSVQRRPFFRRAAWSLLAAVTMVGAAGALELAVERGTIDATLHTIGTILTLAAAALFGLRALVNFITGLRRRTETIRIFDQGFTWTRGDENLKYGWGYLKTYREGGRGLYLGKRPLLQWGAQRLTMRDGRVFRITGAYGDLRRYAAAIRPYAARVTGTQMGRILREEHPVKLHRQLTVWPGGVEAGKKEIPWSEVEAKLRGSQLSILQRAKSGKFKTVRRYDTHTVDNVGGFMEVAEATIRNHQRERFEKKPATGQQPARQPTRQANKGFTSKGL